MKIARLTALTLGTLIFVSCEKEENNQNNSNNNLPESYSFENVDFTGQTNRLDMMSEIVAYMKTANSGSEISAIQLQNMFSNDGYTWQQADLNSSTKQLANKIADGEQPTMGSFFQDLELASKSTTAGSNGVAGLVSSNSGTKTYLFDENGHEPLQYIEKVGMGVIFMNQITNVYLADGKMNVDNETVEPGKGTEMQHHWDEAFGYWGVPLDFGTPDFTFDADAKYNRFWAKYTEGRNPALVCNTKLMKAFIKGREAISRKDYDTRDEAINEINMEFGRVQAATAIHYLNAANGNISDDALRNHELSEALAFAYGLKFNKSNGLTPSELEAIFDESVYDNLYEISSTDIIASRDALAEAYGLESVKENL